MSERTEETGIHSAPYVMTRRQQIYRVANAVQVNSQLTKEFQGQQQAWANRKWNYWMSERTEETCKMRMPHGTTCDGMATEIYIWQIRLREIHRWQSRFKGNSRREQGLKWNWIGCQNGSKKRANWAFAMAPHVMAGRRDIYGMSNSLQVNSELTKQFQGQRQTKTSSIQRNSCGIHQGQSMNKARANKKPQFKSVYHSWFFHFNLTGLPKSRWKLDK